MTEEHVCYQCGGFGCHHCNFIPHGKAGGELLNEEELRLLTDGPDEEGVIDDFYLKHTDSRPCACRFLRDEDFGEVKQVEICAAHKAQKDRLDELESLIGAKAP